MSLAAGGAVAPSPGALQVAALQRNVRELIADESFDSAELLGGVVVSLSHKHAASLPGAGEGSLVESLVLLGDALKGKSELKRAIEQYKQALLQRKSVRGNSLSGPGSSSSASPVAADDAGLFDAAVKFRVARCQARLKQRQNAVKTLESVSSRFRTPGMLLLMAQLYQQLGMERPAFSAQREALSGSPYALCALTSLLRRGASEAETLALVRQRAAPEDHAWLSALCEAHAQLGLSQHAASLQAFSRLQKLLGGANAHCLASMGELHAELGDRVAAAQQFHKARACDARALEGMEAYAALLRQQGDLPRLNALTRELMEADETRPEPWLAMAHFSDLKGDTVSAMQFVAKALELDPQCVAAYHFKGALQLRLNQPELSVAALYRAYSLRRDLAAYRGLVNAYLAIPKVSEALRTAKEALQLMPKDARAVLLVGRVLAHTPGDGRKKASKAYAKALKLDPLCVEAATAFADLYLQQHEAQPGGCDMQPAVQVLLQTLQHQSTDALHVKLGVVYSAAADYGAALVQFHSALSYNPDNDEAKNGVERLTKLLQGADPDADEDGDYDLEENDEDDVSQSH